MIWSQGPAKLRPAILWRVLPLAFVCLLGAWFLASTSASRAVEDQLQRHLEDRGRQTAASIADKLLTIVESAEAIAANDLVVNGLIDTVERDLYMERFFQSLRIPGPAGATFAMLDYRGRPIISNGEAVSYENALWLSAVMQGHARYEVSAAGIEVTVPIFYQGSPEGVLVITYGPKSVPEIVPTPESDEAVLIVDGANTLLYFSDATVAAAGAGRVLDMDSEWVAVRYPIAGFEDHFLIIAADREAAFAVLRNMQRSMLAAVLFGLLIIVAAVYQATSLSTKPLAHLIRSIRAISRASDLTGRVKPEGTAEFHALAQSFNDMTGRLEATTMSRNRVDSIMSSMAELLIVTDRNGKIEHSNQAASELLGVSAEDLAGRSVDTFFRDIDTDETVMALLPVALREGSLTLEANCLARGDKRVPVHLSASPLMNRDEELSGFVYCALDITERKKAEETIRRMAMEDPLTGLPNRTEFQRRLQQALALAGRHDWLVAVMLLDLDHFKDVNDTLGHPAGDALLQTVSRRLLSCARESDTVARLGGDEFAVIMTDPRDLDGVALMAKRILAALEEPIVVENRPIHTGSSIGIAVFPSDQSDRDQLVSNADLALYQAKNRGRGTYQLFDPGMQTEVRSRQTLESDLRLALERDELFIEYQPKIDLTTGRVVGAEALLRWQHPERGLISPVQFIPVAESTRLILPICEWVLKTACIQCQTWHQSGLGDLAIAVNISPIQFKLDGLLDAVRSALDKSGLAARYLELEITESTVVEDDDASISILRELKQIGVRLAVDDFGIGYSSLTYLKRFPLDILKIDRSFVANVCTDVEDAAISSAVITLGHILGLTVVAEGIETREQLQLLTEQGCDQVQGFYFSRPVPPELFAAYAKADRLVEVAMASCAPHMPAALSS